MSTKKTLTAFRIEKTDEGYALHIEDDAGETIEFTASPEQMEVVAEAIDDLLHADDAT